MSETPTAIHPAAMVYSSSFEGRAVLAKRAREEAAKSEALTACVRLKILTSLRHLDRQRTDNAGQLQLRVKIPH